MERNHSHTFGRKSRGRVNPGRSKGVDCVNFGILVESGQGLQIVDCKKVRNETSFKKISSSLWIVDALRPPASRTGSESEGRRPRPGTIQAVVPWHT